LRRATLPLDPAKPAFLAVTAGRAEIPKALLPAVEVILDSSGSMKEPVGNQTKMQVAQQVMSDVMEKLPSTIQVGLRLYGHREGNAASAPANGLDPAAKTTRLVLPIAPLDDDQRRLVRQWVNQAAPWGWTPMVHAVLQAKNDFHVGESSACTVVLVSDGMETCGGKVEEIGKAYRGSNIEIVIHVVGFDVEKDPKAKQQLMEIASLGGGKYFTATDAEGLAAALDEALQGIEFVVADQDSGREVARGSVNDEPVALAPGKYSVHVSGLAAKPLDLELSADEVLELRLDEHGGLVTVD
jgi:hypothetical protein